MQILKKISVGGVNGIKGGFVVAATDPSFLAARIMGIASSMKLKPGTFGDALSFIGEFRAINQHGEECASAVCYLPTPADTLLKDALDAAEGQPVNFGFDIYVVPTVKKSTADRGYEFKIKPLLETKASNPLDALMKGLPAPEIVQKQPQLPLNTDTEKAPETAPETSPETAPETAPEKPAKKK